MPGVEKPILLDVPESFTTERLLIRMPRTGDSTALHEAVEESRETLRVWVNWSQLEYDKPVTLADREDFVRQNAAAYMRREGFVLLIRTRAEDRFVGMTSLKVHDWTVPFFEIGYWLRDSACGQGYMTEAVRGLTQFAFEHLQAERLMIRVDTENDASAAVARRAGYPLEATQRAGQRRRYDDTVRDMLIFAMTRADYVGDG